MILTQAELRLEAVAKGFQQYTAQQRVLKENQRIFASKKEYDLFISHSYLDRQLVYGLVELFNKAGYSVYVDWLEDTQLDRTKVTKATAELLRKRMNDSKGLAYIATGNSTDSKWCPWELGYSDGKTKSRCAILPVLESSQSTYKGQEYLSLYPYIDYTDNSGNYEFWVNDNEISNKYVTLSSWLNGSEPTLHTS